jgi:3',5'-cyclic AMP phosphodiesterase CpdA
MTTSMTERDTSILSFGVIADPQYADIEPRLDYKRFYRQSLGKLDAAIGTFNRHELNFVITLGDVIDRDFESFARIMPLYDALKHDALFIPGNHDFAVAEQHLSKVYDRLKMPAPYYAFSRGAIRLILLDGNEVSLFAHPEGHSLRNEAAQRLSQLKESADVNAQSWNGGLSETQFDWLKQQLQAAEHAGQRVVIFCHYPIAPPNRHNLLGYQKVCDLLSSQPHVLAWMNGHNHEGNYGKIGSCHCINFKGMVDTETENTFAIVRLYEDRLEVEGFGREKSALLRL